MWYTKLYNQGLYISIVLIFYIGGGIMNEHQIALIVGFGGVFISASLTALTQYIFLKKESKMSLKIEIARRLYRNLWDIKDLLSKIRTYSISLQNNYDKITLNELSSVLDKYASEYVFLSKEALHSYSLFKPICEIDLDAIRGKMHEWGPKLFKYPIQLTPEYPISLQTTILEIRSELISFEEVILSEMYKDLL